MVVVCFGSVAAPLVNTSLMSAFPESGRSDQQKLGEIKARFRPEAFVLVAPNRCASCHLDAQTSGKDSQLPELL